MDRKVPPPRLVHTIPSGKSNFDETAQKRVESLRYAGTTSMLELNLDIELAVLTSGPSLAKVKLLPRPKRVK